MLHQSPYLDITISLLVTSTSNPISKLLHPQKRYTLPEMTCSVKHKEFNQRFLDKSFFYVQLLSGKLAYLGCLT